MYSGAFQQLHKNLMNVQLCYCSHLTTSQAQVCQAVRRWWAVITVSERSGGAGARPVNVSSPYLHRLVYSSGEVGGITPSTKQPNKEG